MSYNFFIFGNPHRPYASAGIRSDPFLTESMGNSISQAKTKAPKPRMQTPLCHGL